MLHISYQTYVKNVYVIYIQCRIIIKFVLVMLGNDYMYNHNILNMLSLRGDQCMNINNAGFFYGRMSITFFLFILTIL